MEDGDAQLAITRRFQRHYPFTAEPCCPRGLNEHFASALGRRRRGNHAPLIGERAATRDGCGDKHGGGRRAIRSRSSLANRIERRSSTRWWRSTGEPRSQNAATPRLDSFAATRGRNITEGGGAKRRYPFELQLSSFLGDETYN
jgi:hypothetical protein